jgi:hypothetical protein
MENPTRVAVVGICALLYGCAAPPWTKTGLTQQELLRDRYECERQSEAVGVLPTGPYGGLVLVTAQIGWIARKRELLDMCMRSKGYTPGEPTFDTQDTVAPAPTRTAEPVSTPPVSRVTPQQSRPPQTLEEKIEDTRRLQREQWGR